MRAARKIVKFHPPRGVQASSDKNVSPGDMKFRYQGNDQTNERADFGAAKFYLRSGLTTSYGMPGMLSSLKSGDPRGLYSVGDGRFARVKFYSAPRVEFQKTGDPFKSSGLNFIKFSKRSAPLSAPISHRTEAFSVSLPPRHIASATFGPHVASATSDPHIAPAAPNSFAPPRITVAAAQILFSPARPGIFAPLDAFFSPQTDAPALRRKACETQSKRMRA
jgi:hypothetical protein